MSKSIPEIRLETRLIVKRYAELQPGETVTYEDLSKLCGVDVTLPRFRGWLISARRIAERDNPGLWLETVRRIGIKRLFPRDQAAAIALGCDKVSRTARRSLKRSGNVEWDKLDDSQKASVNASRTILQLVKNAAGSAGQKKIVAAVTAAGNELPLAKALEHFRS